MKSIEFLTFFEMISKQVNSIFLNSNWRNLKIFNHTLQYFRMNTPKKASHKIIKFINSDEYELLGNKKCPQKKLYRKLKKKNLNPQKNYSASKSSGSRRNMTTTKKKKSSDKKLLRMRSCTVNLFSPNQNDFKRIIPQHYQIIVQCEQVLSSYQLKYQKLSQQNRRLQKIAQKLKLTQKKNNVRDRIKTESGRRK